jgi:hypothetical protein
MVQFWNKCLFQIFFCICRGSFRIILLCNKYTERFNITFHNAEDILYDHREVKNANTDWSGKVSA